MNLKNKKILVTGADGFIGSHLTEYLVTQGCDVRAFVYYNSFNSWGWLEDSPESVKKSIEIVSGDIRDSEAVRQAVDGCDVIMHLAALIGIPYSYRAPSSYIETNINGTLNILQAAKDCEVQKIVHTSTSEVYGTAQFVPITESHPLQGQSPYSASKIGADQMAYSFFNSFNLPVAIIRPFNTYGPRQSARAVIPTIITQIAQGYDSIRLGSLEPTRDFNYVLDTVKGFYAVAESDQSVGEVINIGNNYEISIGDLAKTIMELMNSKINIEVDQDRLRPEKSEVERLWADNAKAKALTGWEPTYFGSEGIRQGLAETIEWFRKQSNLEKYKGYLCNI